MLSSKFIGKYMRMAKQVGEDENPCYSRHIGVVLVRVHEDGASRIVSTGYNGPPRKTPHCDAPEYLSAIVWPQLKPEEKAFALAQAPAYLIQNPEDDTHQKHVFKQAFENCHKCPRRLIGAKTGERVELCSCEHAEKNAIANASEDLHGCWAFCWCGLACWDCAKLMINAGIKRAFFIDDGSYARNGGSDYSFGVRWLFAQADLEFSLELPEVYLKS